MIHALALPLLLSGASPAPTTLQAIPANPVFALHIDGGEELRDRLEDNAWLSLAMELSSQPVDDVLSEFDLPALEAWIEDIDDISVFISAGDDPMGTMGLFVQSEGGDVIEQAFAHLREMLEQEVEPLSDEDGVVLYDVSELGISTAGDTWAVELALVEHGQIFGAVASDESGLSASIASGGARAFGEQPGGIANAYAELDGAQVGLHLNVGFVLELMQEEVMGPEGEMLAGLFRGLSDIGIAVSFGEGGAVEGLLHIAYEEDSLAAEFAGMFTPFDHDLLDWAPKDVAAISIVGVDWVGVVDVILGLADEVEPGASDEAAESLDAFAEQTGVHVIDDLVSLLEGSVLSYFTDIPDFEASVESEELPGIGYVIALEDHEAFEENLLAIVESEGVMELVAVDELSHGNLYTIPSFPFEMGIGVGRGALAFAMGDALVHVEEMLAGGNPTGASENQFVRHAMQENEGSASIAVWDVSMLVMLAEMEDVPFDFGDLLDDLEGTFVFTTDVSSTAMWARAELR